LTLYLLASAGLTLRAHYCGGDLASLAIFEKASCCCDEEAPVNNNDCCKDEVKTFKISDEQRKVEPDNKLAIGLSDASITAVSFLSIEIPSVELNNADISLPADPVECNKPPAYHLYHSLLFYS
jgi:hypothetical protein